MTHEPDIDRLRRQLSNIVSNAELIPDPRTNGATDAYLVPLDDIDAAADLLMEATPPEVRSYYKVATGAVRLLHDLPRLIDKAVETAKKQNHDPR